MKTKSKTYKTIRICLICSKKFIIKSSVQKCCSKKCSKKSKLKLNRIYNINYRQFHHTEILEKRREYIKKYRKYINKYMREYYKKMNKNKRQIYWHNKYVNNKEYYNKMSYEYNHSKNKHCKCGRTISNTSKHCPLCSISNRRGKRIKYRKIWMKSSYEVAYAKYLDKQDTRWQYEPKTFDLGNTTYTPDFYLPKTKEYIEIKGWWWNDSKSKYLKFKRRFGNIILLNKSRLKKLGILK